MVHPHRCFHIFTWSDLTWGICVWSVLLHLSRSIIGKTPVWVCRAFKFKSLMLSYRAATTVAQHPHYLNSFLFRFLSILVPYAMHKWMTTTPTVTETRNLDPYSSSAWSLDGGMSYLIQFSQQNPSMSSNIASSSKSTYSLNLSFSPSYLSIHLSKKKHLKVTLCIPMLSEAITLSVCVCLFILRA